ncbi:hypothetical protein C8R43DRAFT_1021983 [Mycena crocata]|nr:hypothetical protein C8R43DRAFT_1021983 [Mycena crocata]
MHEVRLPRAESPRTGTVVLMTVVIGTLVTQVQVGIPWMKTRRIRSSAFIGNYGSVKVLQKNGFVLEDTLVDHVQIGDEKRTLHLLEWRR